MSDAIRVLVADDHPVVRAGIVALIGRRQGFQVVGEASTGRQAVELAVRERPDVVLMDLQMPEGDGVEATRQMRETVPGVAVLVLTTFDDDELIWDAVAAGAKGYLLKDAEPETLFAAVRDVAAGRTLLPPEILSRLTQVIQQGGPAARSADEGLTAREQEVLQRIARGLSNKEIAAELFISENTVKTHISNLFEKLGVSDRTEAVTKALRLGWLKL